MAVKEKKSESKSSRDRAKRKAQRRKQLRDLQQSGATIPSSGAGKDAKRKPHKKGGRS